jgi:hopene-associated glycosyltransferase HpnB
MLALALLSLAIWLYLLLFHGRFWRASERLRPAPAPDTWPDVAIIVPARNEAETIEAVVSAHMGTRYPGRARLFLVDDGSDDGTADIANAAADGRRAFTLLKAPPLAPGWSGKLWALHHGIAAALEAMPEAPWLLLTDADIVHGPALLEHLVATAEADGLSLLSVMSRLDARGFWGGLLVPAFIYFFQKLYPFPLVNDAASRVAGAAGGVVLIRRAALDAIGGIESIRAALIDDCTLAARVKGTGAPIRLVLADGHAPATSLRDNRSYASIRAMVSRTAYSQLGFSPLMLLGTVLGMVLLYLVPPAAVLLWGVHGSAAAAAAGVAAWGLMAITYLPTLVDYGLARWRAFTLPVAGLLYTGFTLSSAFAHHAGRGGRWKGRTYS